MRFASSHFSRACVVSSASDELSSTSRISTGLGDSKFHLVGRMGLFVAIVSKSEEERGAATGLGLSPDSAAVTVNDSLHGGQANARAFEFFLAVQTLKHTEQFVGVFRVETHSVVAHEKRFFAVFC